MTVANREAYEVVYEGTVNLVEDVDDVIDDLTMNNGSPDHLHPGTVGQAIYARYVIGATQ